MRTLSLRTRQLFGNNGNYGRGSYRSRFVGGTVDEAAAAGVETGNLDELHTLGPAGLAEYATPGADNPPDSTFYGAPSKLVQLANDLGLPLDTLDEDRRANNPTMSAPDYLRNVLTMMLADPVPIYATRPPFIEPGNTATGVRDGGTPAKAGIGIGTVLLIAGAAYLLFGRRR